MIFFGDMRVEENSARGAECRIVRAAGNRGAERSASPSFGWLRHSNEAECISSNESPAQRVSFEASAGENFRADDAVGGD